jgi:hypothetical protein
VASARQISLLFAFLFCCDAVILQKQYGKERRTEGWTLGYYTHSQIYMRIWIAEEVTPYRFTRKGRDIWQEYENACPYTHLMIMVTRMLE